MFYSDVCLPAGVYRARSSYPLEAFDLGEKAVKDLAAYEKLTGQTIPAVRFTGGLLEQAQALGALQGRCGEQLLAGGDVAS